MNILVRKLSAITLGIFFLGNILVPNVSVYAESDELIYPLKEISKLECRFRDFDTLSANCKQNLPILNTRDYAKYAKQNGGYNDFTRIYTVLWGSSYKYGWDVGNGGHQGTDFATAKGTPVYSIADGKVITVGNDNGWGKHVSIEHTIRGQKVISNYAHLHKIYVSTGDKVSVGKKIGEVGSTGNSTGNHLHFQIDLPSAFHPYYYDWNACPYSYYKITEEGVCFDELTRHTFDPLEFLETNGAIIDDIKIETSKEVTKQDEGVIYKEIFNETVYYEYGNSNDVKQVQMVYSELGYYDGPISGRFSDVEEAIIDYQVDSGVLKTRSDDGAGWFGPKTRAQTKKDYDAFLASGKQPKYTKKEETKTETTTEVVKEVKKVETISRQNLMTREEREKLEVEEFMRKYDIDVSGLRSFIEAGTTASATLAITDNRDRGFKGSTPGTISFDYDKSKISVFPESFFHFRDGERTIKITGKTNGVTKLKIKLGDTTIKTVSISIGKSGVAPEVESAKIYSPKSKVVGMSQTAIVLMKDQHGNKLIKAPYKDTFTVSDSGNIEYCLKRGGIGNIKSIYKRECSDDEYTSSLSFEYADTIDGLVIFDYRVTNAGSSTIEIKKANTLVGSYTNKSSMPRDLAANHNYYNSTKQALENGIITTDTRGYVAMDKGLTKLDAAKWIERSFPYGDRTVLQTQEVSSTFEKITREEFLQLYTSYTGIKVNNSKSTNLYKDTDENQETLIVSVLGNDYKWKDQFGKNYFQPDKTLTRGEATYLLQNLQNRNLVRN